MWPTVSGQKSQSDAKILQAIAAPINPATHSNFIIKYHLELSGSYESEFGKDTLGKAISTIVERHLTLLGVRYIEINKKKFDIKLGLNKRPFFSPVTDREVVIQQYDNIISGEDDKFQTGEGFSSDMHL